MTKAIGGTALYWFPFAAFLVVLSCALLPQGGYIGHDYTATLTRLLIGSNHFWQNGLAVPHYTASLCGGIPLFADPQSLYYSFLQFLSFFIEPWLAAQIGHLVLYIVGYWGMLKTARDRLALSHGAAHFCALLFVLNLFSYAHLLVGHLTFHSYLLFPWLLYFLLGGPATTRLGSAKLVSGLALVAIYTFFSGGLHVCVIFATGFLVLLPFLFLFHAERKSLRPFFVTLLYSGGVVLLACSGKLIASVLYSKNFVTGGIDLPKESAEWMLFRFFWYFSALTPDHIDFGQLRIGTWEYVGALSKVTLPLLLLFPSALLGGRGRVTKAKIYFFVFYAVYLLWVLNIALRVMPGLVPPIFNHYHMPIRLLAAFLPALILASGYVIDWLSRTFSPQLTPRKRLAIFALAALLLVVEFRLASRSIADTPNAVTFYYERLRFSSLAQVGKLPRVDRIVGSRLKDLEGLANGTSSYRCYEPIFGYRQEAIRTQLTKGKTELISNARFNINHPGCFIYRTHFQCDAWDRISSTDTENFEKFVNGKTPAWGVPWWQQLTLTIGFVTVLMLGLIRFASPLKKFMTRPARTIRLAEAR